MIAFVRGVIAASTCAGSMLSVSGSMSTKTGVAPTSRMVLPVAAKLNGVVITSSPAPMPCANSATCSAAVPDETATASDTPHSSAKRRSNSSTCLPWANCPDASTFATASCSSGLICGWDIAVILLPSRLTYLYHIVSHEIVSASATPDVAAVGPQARLQPPARAGGGPVLMWQGPSWPRTALQRVGLVAVGAGAAHRLRRLDDLFQLAPALTDPGPHARRIAIDQRVRRHVPRHHRATAHQRERADGNTRHDGRVRADGRPVFHRDRRHRPVVRGLQRARRRDRPRDQVVGEADVRAYEHAILDGHAVVDRDIVLYLHPVADAHIVVNVDIAPDDHLGPDTRSLADLRVAPYLAPPADLRPWGDLGRRMDVDLTHDKPPECPSHFKPSSRGDIAAH